MTRSIRALIGALDIRAALLSGAAFTLWAVPAMAQDEQAGEANPANTVETTRTQIDGQSAIIVAARRFVPEGASTASKSDIPLVETPQSISVITRDQIDLLSFIDAQQAVRYTSGAFGETYGPDPRFDFVTVRGFTPKYYIDGLANPATTTIAATGLDIYAFQTLEVLKGPASVLYGSAPPGGIINETTRRAASDFGGEFVLKGGSNRYLTGAGTFTGPVTDFLDVRVTGLYRDTEGEIDFQRVRRLFAAPTATLRLGSNTRLTGLAYYQYDNNLGGNGGFLPLYGTLLPTPDGRKIKRSTNLSGPADKYERRQSGLGYEFEHKFGGGLTFTSNSRWSRYNEQSPIGLYSGGGYTNITDPTLPSYYNTLAQWNFSYAERVSSFATDNRVAANFATGAVEHKLLVGIDYRNVRNVAAYNFDFAAGTIDAFDPIYDPAFQQDIGFPTRYNDQKLQQTGVYGQDQLAFGNLRVLLGARYDWVKARSATNTFLPVTTPAVFASQKQHKFTYRIGANYVTDSGFAPYVSYATSFEPVLGTDSITGDPFKPTSAKQIEAGIKYDARGLPDGVKLFATLAAFDVKQKNFVVTQAGQTPVFGTQGGLVEVYGVEAEVVARFNEQLSINAAYSYTHSEIKSDPNAPANVGYPLPTTPKHKASLFADYTFQKGALGGFGFGGGVRYSSESAGGLFAGSAPYVVTGSATLFDAIVHYDLPGWRISVNGSNIFDKNYVARCTGLYGCVYGAGRQIIGTVSRKF